LSDVGPAPSAAYLDARTVIMDQVVFDVAPLTGDPVGVLVVTPVVNATSLVELVGDFEAGRGYRPAGGYAGIAGSQCRFGDLAAHYLGTSPTAQGRVMLLGCDCGEVACWPLVARVAVDDDSVTWSEFGQPYREDWDYTGFGPLVFARPAYDRAVADAVRTLG
jgi:hypothetical protein